MRFALICLFVCANAFGAVGASANTYYVSPNGDDANPGTASLPWRTIQQAAAAMSAGDTALIGDGDYAGGIVQRESGTASAPITFRAINPGGPVVWGDQTINVDAFWINHSDYIVVDGLTIRNANRAAVRVDNSNHCTVRRCVALDSQTTGLYANYSDDLLFEYNECAYSVEQHGIYVANGGDRPVVRYNVCHDNARAGIQLNGDGKFVNEDLGTRGDGVIEDGQVVCNAIYDNGLNDEAAAINLMSVRTTLIANNLLYNNRAGGISMSNDNVASETQWGCKDNRILHNTVFFRPNEGRWCVSALNGSTGNLVQNNILYGGYRGAYQFDASSLLTADFNLLPTAGVAGTAVNGDTQQFYTFDEWRQFSGNDSHSSEADPLFINQGAAPYDFHLQPNSPALGTGAAAFDVGEDLEGNPRPSGGSDLGCYEDGPPAGSPSTYTISGKVTFNGSGVSAAEIIAGTFRTTTAKDGTYALTGLRPGTYTLSASHPSYKMSAAVSASVGPNKSGVNFSATTNLVGVTLATDRVLGSEATTGKVTLAKKAPPGGTLLTLSSGNACAAVPATVKVSEGTTSATFPITTSPVGAETQVTISASLGLANVSDVLTVTPPMVSSLSLAPPAVAGGNASTATVTLTGPAPQGGRIVLLSSSSAATAGCPASVTVPEGTDTATFSVQTTPVTVEKSVTISAATGNSNASATLKVTTAGLAAVTFDPPAVVGGNSSQCTVSLTGPAPSGGLILKLAAKPAGVTVPATVTIPAGASKATVPVKTLAVSVDTAATVTATLGKAKVSGTLSVLAPTLVSISITPTTVAGGANLTGTVVISSPAGVKGLVVTMDSDTKSVAKVARRLTIPPGATSATFTVTTRKPTVATKVLISAASGNTTKTQTITVQ